MKYLMDTHTLLWYTLSDSSLNRTARELIIDRNNEILISPASYWEIAIKISIGKLQLHQSYRNFMEVCLHQYGFEILAISPEHTETVIALPFHHKDPFDRLMIAQAIVERIPLISADTIFDRYNVQRIW
ncbi:MAG: type II toxin-antitoxin system VapC family toxin [Microcystaceae cyanobacterium]